MVELETYEELVNAGQYPKLVSCKQNQTLVVITGIRHRDLFRVETENGKVLHKSLVSCFSKWKHVVTRQLALTLSKQNLEGFGWKTFENWPKNLGWR